MSANPYSVQDIAEMVNGQLFCSAPDAVIGNLLIDSRKAYSPKNSVFVALIGERHNGHKYINTLKEKGIENFIISDKQYVDDTANYILVDNTTKALQNIALAHRQKIKCPVIGITGSNGKTIVKEWLYQLLKDNFLITRNPKSYNSQVGVPLSVWLLNEDTQLGIFEAGISTIAEMEKLESIIQPQIGIFTNIGSAHDDGFVNIQEKIREKSILFKRADKIIFCKEYHEIDKHLRSVFDSNKLFTWSKEDINADVYVNSIVTNNEFTSISLAYRDEIIDFSIPFFDAAAIENSIHCVCTLIVLNKYVPSTLGNTKKLAPVAMRLELKEGVNQCTLINDTYNSDVNSLKVALDSMNQQQQQLKKTLILSDILESNRNEELLYAEIAKLVNSYNLDKFIGIGNSLNKYKNLFSGENQQFYSTTIEFLSALGNDSFRQETILIKGARDFVFEKIVKRLELKAHETRLEIDLSALVDNLNYYKAKLNKSTKIMAMVKAFSYGSGSVEIANVLQYNRIDYLAVAYTDEGVELRNSGITTPIMVMNSDIGSFEIIIKFKLEPEIYSFAGLGNFIEALERNYDSSNLPYPIHIKVDSGMHRLGFTLQEANQLGLILKNCKSVIKVASVFSHLAASSDVNQKKFTFQQINHFKQFCRIINTQIEDNYIRHILNSGGIDFYPEAQFEMVRIGIGLYGISASKTSKINLQPISTLKSSISQIKLIEKGDTVGYNRNGKISAPTRIAIIAIGYADGVNRKLGNGNYYFLINNQEAYTIGDICMDMCTVDVTNIACKPGDEVILFGKELPIEIMSETLGTIPYEVLTGISRRVNRVYYQE